MNAAWISLLVAGLFEVGWPIGLKNGWTDDGAKPLWILFAGACLLASGALLLYAQRSIPIGTAYAVWTGIGAAGTAALGIILFSESTNPLRLASIALIIAGIVGLKLTTD